MTVNIKTTVDVEKHLRELHENGYTIVQGLLSKNEVTQLRTEMDRQIE